MNRDILILAVETSCDETSVSVIKNGNTILSNIVLSQIESHKRFGGVVPEVASRHHVEGITTTIDEALSSANVTMEDIDAIAVTQGPGLIGALLIGINAAKALAFAYNKPVIPVHHIAGHIYANHLEEPLVFPLIALIVSISFFSNITKILQSNFLISDKTFGKESDSNFAGITNVKFFNNGVI